MCPIGAASCLICLAALAQPSSPRTRPGGERACASSIPSTAIVFFNAGRTFAKDDAELITRREAAQAPSSSSVGRDPAAQKSHLNLGGGSDDGVAPLRFLCRSTPMPTDKKRPKPPPGPTDYEVGYRKPPKASRFAAGQSGNPKGRPKGACNKSRGLNEPGLRAIILAEAYRTIKVNEGKRQISIPMATAVLRSVAVHAARGQVRSQQLFSRLYPTRSRRALYRSSESSTRR